MSRFAKIKFLCAAIALVVVARAPSALACAACFGNSDSPLAKGMNWGIFSLLAVVVGVLGGIAGFAVLLARRAAAFAAAAPPDEIAASTSKT